MNRLAHKIHKLRKKVDGMATDSESEKEAIKKEIERLLEEKRSIPSQVMNDQTSGVCTMFDMLMTS